jgi:pyruvate/2-oxoglutarate/acetoin dehydrogenase E1 component
MKMVAAHPRSVFLGQAVAYAGTAMFTTLADVPMEKRIELPVAEDMQLGLCIGAALNGDLPICCYPRWNFLLLATSQLVLHLDKIPLFSGYRPRVLIRTSVATPHPLDPGPQHLGDYSEPYRAMLKTVVVVCLDKAEDIVLQYRIAMEREGSTILIEYASQYA